MMCRYCQMPAWGPLGRGIETLLGEVSWWLADQWAEGCLTDVSEDVELDFVAACDEMWPPVQSRWAPSVMVRGWSYRCPISALSALPVDGVTMVRLSDADIRWLDEIGHPIDGAEGPGWWQDIDVPAWFATPERVQRMWSVPCLCTYVELPGIDRCEVVPKRRAHR